VPRDGQWIKIKVVIAKNDDRVQIILQGKHQKDRFGINEIFVGKNSETSNGIRPGKVVIRFIIITFIGLTAQVKNKL
jgi:hypothetical protein